MSAISSLLSSQPTASAGGLGLGGALGLGALSSAVGDIGSIFSTNSANTAASNAQDKAFSEELYLSDTAPERAVQGDIAAGLNPILAAGAPASTPSVPQAPVMAPQISSPDLMAGMISIKQLQQADSRLAIDQANSASNIAKNLTDNQLTKMQTILEQRGIIPAQLEGQGAALLQKMIGPYLQQVTSPDPKNLHSPPSSGGEIMSPDDINFQNNQPKDPQQPVSFFGG